MSWLSGSKTLFRTNTMPKRSAAQISSADVKPKGKAGKATAVAAVRPSKREPESESDEHDAEADADDALLDQMAHQGNDDYSGSESEDDGMESVSDIIARLQRERRAAKKNKSSTKQSATIAKSSAQDLLPTDILALAEEQRKVEKKTKAKAAANKQPHVVAKPIIQKAQAPGATLEKPVNKDGFNLVVLNQNNAASLSLGAANLDSSKTAATLQAFRARYQGSVSRAPVSRAVGQCTSAPALVFSAKSRAK